jgi:ADP-heptose:LPS heptosyltransferase
LDKILVIKLSALGDVVLSMAPLRRIRQAHPEAELTVLTTPAYAALYSVCPWVDRVWSDGRPRDLKGLVALVRRLRQARFRRVYDLQTQERSTVLFHLLRPFPPEWSGLGWGASHAHRVAHRQRMHPLELQADQLRVAGIWPDAPTAPGTAPGPDLSWALGEGAADRGPEHFGLAEPYALLVPGASVHRPGKRWPTERYAALAAALRAEGYDVAVIGGSAEQALAQAIPAAKDLTGRTDILQLAGLGVRAALVVGNDTGPTHVLAAAGAPTLVLFSGQSDPALSAPRGPGVITLRRQSLADLTLQDVLSACGRLARL